MTTIDLDVLNRASTAAFCDALSDIFEHSPWVVEAAAARRPFGRATDLMAVLADAVRSAGPERQLALIRAHPDLAGKAARAGGLTAHSAAEQAGAGLDRLSDQEYADFHRLNDAYRVRFGFPFIICVRRHSKDSILAAFERRLGHEPAAEQDAALTEVLRIAALRLDGRVAGPDRLKVHGRLSTHVLDTHRGRPAAGVAVELVELSVAGESRTVARAVTNADGRTDEPLIASRPVPIGRYELRFSIGDYYASAGIAAAEPPFLDVVPVRFGVAEPEGHYHVPLLVTPWAYSTYRGS